MKRIQGMLVVGLGLVALFFTTDAARADRRSLVWSQQYHTMAQGQTELEYYLTQKTDDLGDYGDENSWEHQFELEYGVTDHFQLAIYQRFQNTNGTDDDGFDYTGTKIEGKYRIGEKGDLPVDAAIYVEYARGEGANEEDAMEYKLILSKDFGAYNITYNQIIEDVVADGDETEHEYTAGVFYECSPSWHVGIESTGSYTENEYRVGPTVSWASEKFWMAVGVLGGLNHRTDDLRGRLIVGLPF